MSRDPEALSLRPLPTGDEPPDTEPAGVIQATRPPEPPSPEVFMARVARDTFTPDWDVLVAFPVTELRAGCASSLSFCLADHPETRGRRVYPKRLYVPREVASGMEVRNVFVPDGVEEQVPLLDGRAWHAELFDGDRRDGQYRDVPYGLLPRVPAKVDATIVVEVKNPTVHDRTGFLVVMAVDYVP